MITQLIGSVATVVESKNKSLIGITGKIIDETKNTITINTGEKQKTIIKSQVSLEINKKIINGKKIQKRPEEIK